jgi:TonB family protein
MQRTAGILLLACGAAVGAQEPIVQPQVRPGTIYASPIDPRPPQPTPDGVRMKVGGEAAAANLINQVDPVYPPLARQTRISGTVKLCAVIGKDGAVRQLDVISGHPLLVQSALDAVRKWKYQPTQLDGEAVEVDTTIDVIFALNDNTQQSQPKLMVLAPKSIDLALRADVLALLQENHVSRASETVMRKMFDGLRPTVLRGFAEFEDREKILDAYENKLIVVTNTAVFFVNEVIGDCT